MRVIVFALAAVIQLAAAAVGFVILLISMNGYNERDATPGIYLYIFLGVVSALALGILSAFVAGRLVERGSFGGLAASAAAVLGSGVVGGIIVGVSFFAAIILAEAVRGSR